jgi:hypothetical protein
MEAAGAPRLDVERPSESWSAAQRGALVSVGLRAGTRAGLRVPSHAGAGAEERSARPPLTSCQRVAWGPPQLRARDAGALSSSSDPS